MGFVFCRSGIVSSCVWLLGRGEGLLDRAVGDVVCEGSFGASVHEESFSNASGAGGGRLIDDGASFGRSKP